MHFVGNNSYFTIAVRNCKFAAKAGIRSSASCCILQCPGLPLPAPAFFSSLPSGTDLLCLLLTYICPPLWTFLRSTVSQPFLHSSPWHRLGFLRLFKGVSLLGIPRKCFPILVLEPQEKFDKCVPRSSWPSKWQRHRFYLNYLKINQYMIT